MQVDAARCAAAGPSRLGGSERRNTHSVNNLVSVAARGASTRRNIFFKAKPRNSCAGAKRRGRVFEARSRVLFAATGSHTSCARWRKPRRYPPFERTPLLEHDRINKHHDRFSSPFGCILPIFRKYPASRSRFFSHLWDANPGRWNQGRKCKGC